MIGVLAPGLLTTVQDRGRRGQGVWGVSPGGAADAVALRVANLVAGNAEGAAALEATLLGPRLVFERASVIALAGADLGATVDGRSVPLGEPVEIVQLHFLVERCAVDLELIGGRLTVPVVGAQRTEQNGAFGLKKRLIERHWGPLSVIVGGNVARERAR